jgi:hypothetical protein
LSKPPPSKSPKTEKEREEIHSKANAYLKYSGMAFEMAAIIAVFTFAGKKLDGCVKGERPYFTILGAFIGTVAALYLTLKDIIFRKKNE